MTDGPLDGATDDGRNDELRLEPPYLTVYDKVAFAAILAVSLCAEAECKGRTCIWLVAKTFSISPFETYFDQLVTLGVDPHKAALVDSCISVCFLIAFVLLFVRVTSELINKGTKLSKHALGTKCLLIAGFLMLALVLSRISDKPGVRMSLTTAHAEALNVLYYGWIAIAISSLLSKWFGQWLAFRR